MKNMELNKLTCDPKQSRVLVTMGINAVAFFWHHYAQRENSETSGWDTAQFKNPLPGDDMVPAWTFAELAAMIGPQFSKPDLWNESRREKAATDPNTYPVFLPDKCFVYENAAQAAAHGLIYLLENEFINAADCNDRYAAIFFRP